MIIHWEIIPTLKKKFLNPKVTEQQNLQEKRKLRKILCVLQNQNKTKSRANYG